MASLPAAAKGRRARPHAGRFRIIGGEWRGRRIAIPEAPGVRPTPDRVRETLFNWLAPVIEGARCLDLFAGSGALGLEALSRGAARVVFVDREPRVLACIGIALETVRCERATLARADGLRYLAREATLFDIVFLDPPYRENLVPQALDRLAAGGWLAPGASIYIESERQAGVPSPPPGWHVARSATAGQVGYHLARPEPPGAGTDR